LRAKWAAVAFPEFAISFILLSLSEKNLHARIPENLVIDLRVNKKCRSLLFDRIEQFLSIFEPIKVQILICVVE